MKRRTRLGALAAFFGAGLAGLVMAAAPGAAAASEMPSLSGYIEICKTFNAGPSGAPMYMGTFNYKISDGSFQKSVSVSALQGGPQVCTAPIAVPAGAATVTELSQPWSSVTSISGTQGDPGAVYVPPNSSGTAVLQVLPAPSPGNVSLTTTVQYTNDPVTGIIEVCKQAAKNAPSLTGTYNFNLTSENDGINVYDSKTGAYDLPWTTTASATISSGGLGCSGPITVPAGTMQTVEPGTTYVTSITAFANFDNQLLGWPDLAHATSVQTVNAGDTTNQTIVTYTDSLSTVKLCKAWDGPWAPNTVFPFTLSSSGVSGPTAVTGSVGLTVGSCQIVGTVRAGTQVNITEGVVPGTKVDSIGVSPLFNSQGMSPIVPKSLSLPNRTISVIAGAGETDVTFTDQRADPGLLKICVAPNSHGATGTAAFSVNGSQTINVNLSTTAIQCTLDPMPFAFDSAVNIVGSQLPSTLNFSGMPTVAPTNVEVMEGGVPTPTNQLSLSSGTASSATVLMSEGIVTEVTFSVDPPAPVVGPTQTDTPTPAEVAAVSDTGGTPSGVPSGPVGGPVSGPAIVAPAPAPTAAVTTAPAIKKQVSAKVLKLEKQLKSTKAQIKQLQKKLKTKHLSVKARKAYTKRLAQLRRLERSQTLQLKKLR